MATGRGNGVAAGGNHDPGGHLLVKRDRRTEAGHVALATAATVGGAASGRTPANRPAGGPVVPDRLSPGGRNIRYHGHFRRDR